MKHIVILGSTGSVGTQTLDVIERLQDRLRVVGLSAYRNESLLKAQSQQFCVPTSALECGEDADLVRLSTLSEADIVVVAVAGSVGIRATLAALKAGKDVALATKEVLVAAGEIVMRAAHAGGGKVLPIDSEHSAIFQCLHGQNSKDVDRLWLTASGGPFREWSAERMAKATLGETLHHPTWPNMGRKITVDSATMMNKALEMIEAHWLFGVPMERVGIVIHPQSVVHSLVEMCDGSVLAQFGLPDMRVPIEYALLYPDRVNMGIPRYDILAQKTPLTFEPPDEARFPSLALARRAAETGGTLPAVMNAANEAAVSFFLDEKISFSTLTSLVEQVMDAHIAKASPELDQIIAADGWAREMAMSMMGNNA